LKTGCLLHLMVTRRQRVRANGSRECAPDDRLRDVSNHGQHHVRPRLSRRVRARPPEMRLSKVSGMTGLTTGISLASAVALWCATAAAQNPAQDQSFPPQQIATGAEIFARNCSPCHGPRMQDPESAFDLRKFPPGEHDRFVRSVTNGKNQMPPWGDLLKSDDIEALWAYVTMGEKK
jgi:mono/diheme cytochrome c family protein